LNEEHDLARFGLTPELAIAFQSSAADGLRLGRVGAQFRGGYVLYTEQGDLAATAPGRMRKEPGGLPAVGDWVTFELLAEGKGVVRAILPRSSKLSRAQRDLN